jgi:hypothetical protein
MPQYNCELQDHPTHRTHARISAPDKLSAVAAYLLELTQKGIGYSHPFAVKVWRDDERSEDTKPIAFDRYPGT